MTQPVVLVGYDQFSMRTAVVRKIIFQGVKYEFFSGILAGGSNAQDNRKIQQRVLELGIEELVRNVVHQGGDSKIHAEAAWEGCRLVFAAQPKADAHSQLATTLANMFDAAKSSEPNHEFGTSIIMADGTFLYNSVLDGAQVKAFREGPWVERLTAYSKQLTEQRLQREREEEQKRLEEQRKPFQNIDF